MLLYIPEFQRSIKGAEFDVAKVEEFKNMFFGTLLKIGYAFLWQEFFIPIDFMYNDFGLLLGSLGMASLNHYINKFNGII